MSTCQFAWGAGATVRIAGVLTTRSGRRPLRYVPLAALLTLGCVTTSVGRLSPVRYEARPNDTPIQLFSSQLPTCAFTELAIVKARRETWMVSTTAAVDALRKKARQLGGDALVRLSFDDGTDVTGTVIRFEQDDCMR